ncbi:MAG: RNA-binding protein [Firmicutes bacterium]|nr:RNA-binding protein [Bacillota bacterium]
MDAQLGQLVTSRAGRDSGQRYLVVGYNGQRVLVADGRLRSVKRPKHKNIRHICFHKVVAEEISAKLLANISVSDADIRAALDRLQDGGEEVD